MAENIASLVNAVCETKEPVTLKGAKVIGRFFELEYEFRGEKRKVKQPLF